MGINEFEYLQKLFEDRFDRLTSDMGELKDDMKMLRKKIDTLSIENARREITCPNREIINKLRKRYDYEDESRRRLYRNITLIVSIATVVINVILKAIEW